MKIIKSIVSVLVVTAVGLVAQSCATEASAASDGYVYICTGPNAKVYHSSANCRGLNKCSGEVKKIPRSATKRRACKVCY